MSNEKKGKALEGMGEPRSPGTVLDVVQLKRIEAVHCGFLYQHLYGVACLLSVGRQSGTIVMVERDEDVEVATKSEHFYQQVKTRSRPLQYGDIKDALVRFETIREEHRNHKRDGTPSFRVITNSEPGPKLATTMASDDWPSDTVLVTPERPHADILPPAWVDLESAIKWCTERAALVPFGGLQPETLVWKLAARVQHVATGVNEHRFTSDEMPALLEQLIAQLQDFPEPPDNYRPQIDEPPLVSEDRLRLLVGFSGAGKTAWASQAALHCPETIIYFDVGDLPASSVANSLARELAARFLGGRAHRLGGALLAESAGMDVLRACAIRLAQDGMQITVVVDNAHRMSADSIRTVVEAAPGIRFLWIAQPWDGQAKIEAIFGIKAEQLAGWSHDEIAAEFNGQNCPIGFGTARRVSSLTGGLPLYVRSAARLADSVYGQDAQAMCEAIEERTHAEHTTQEVLLDEVFGNVTVDARRAAALISISEVTLATDETLELLSVIWPVEDGAKSLRELQNASLLVGFQGGRIALHDALRPVAGKGLDQVDTHVKESAFHKLYEILARSLSKERDIPRLNAVLRLLPKIGRSDALVDLATHEMFHEQGDQRTLRTELELAAVNAEASASDRFWAHDALAYWESRDGGRPSDARLDEMGALIEIGDLSHLEKLGLCFKRLAAAGSDGDREAIERTFASGKKLVRGRPDASRMLRYNRAVALYRIHEYVGVLREIEPLIAEYYRAIGLTEADVFMKNGRQLYEIMSQPLDVDNIKRLADNLSLWCSAQVKLNRPPMLRRIHATKLYAVAQAARSAVSTGLEAVDDFLVIMADPIGARELMEENILPLVREFHLTDMLAPVRSIYAIVLAWCGEMIEARREMATILEYGGTDEEKMELRKRADFIEQISKKEVFLAR